MVLLAAALGVAIGIVTSGSSGSTPPRKHHASAARPRTPRKTAAVPARSSKRSRSDLRRLVGQLIIGRYTGPTPDASFLTRVRGGELGGVILFADNTAAGLAATRRAIAHLQRAARQGGNPPLLVMADQEGGEVNRVPGPPTLAPAEMDSAAVAEQQGAAAGRLLRSVGINVDLAPVADVERAPGSFLGTRSFGSDPNLVAARACAFARGLASGGVAYTLKHFPGLGRATGDTDTERVVIDAPAAELRDDYSAYRSCGASPNALVMVSSAIYPTLSGSTPAVMSPEIYNRELPTALGQAGHLTISDALDTPAFSGEQAAALRAINAGLDLALYANTEAESISGYTELLAAARRGAIPASRLRSAVYAVDSLKRRLR